MGSKLQKTTFASFGVEKVAVTKSTIDYAYYSLVTNSYQPASAKSTAIKNPLPITGYTDDFVLQDIQNTKMKLGGAGNFSMWYRYKEVVLFGLCLMA